MPTPDELLARRNELLDRTIDEEVAAHGFPRPPWLLYPGENPFSIAWRMGNGEDQIMRWTRWLPGRTSIEIVGAIMRFGAVPADWAWWAAEVAGFLEVDDIYEVPFEQVRERLVSAGLVVEGELWTE